MWSGVAATSLRGLRPVSIGVILGGVVSLPAGRVLEAALYGISAVDWLTLAGSAGTVLLVGLMAAGLCALGAARIHPLEALKGD